MAVINWIINILIVVGVGGGIGYFSFLKLKAKPKQTWKARIWRMGDGIKEPVVNKDGKIISNVRLRDLIPFGKDLAERLEMAAGVVVYKLQKANKSIPPITDETVDYWGKEDKEVNVLMHKGNCTLLKKGYDSNAGAVFQPMPYERINMIKSEIIIRKDRNKNQKDILAAIAPFVIGGILLFGFLGSAYIMVEGWKEMNTENNKAAENLAKAIEKSGVNNNINNLIQQTKDKDIKKEEPPLIKDE